MRYTKIIEQLIICYNSISSWAAVASFLVFNLYAGTLWLDEKVMKVKDNVKIHIRDKPQLILLQQSETCPPKWNLQFSIQTIYDVYYLLLTLLILNSGIHSSKCSPRNKLNKPMQQKLEDHDTQPRKSLMFKTSSTPMNLSLFQHKQQQGYPQRIGKQYSGIQMILVNDYECK